MSEEKTKGKQISHNLENLKKAGWTVGNTGRARATNYNSKFTMLYRTITKKGTDILATKSIQVEKGKKTLENIGGQGDNMGFPYIDDDPKPALLLSCDDSFAKLKSVLATRSDSPCLNISYDCEYQSVDDGSLSPDNELRVILSYQFALYLTPYSILQVCFLSRCATVDNRLSYRVCLGAIFDLLRDIFDYDCAYNPNSSNVEWDETNPLILVDHSNNTHFDSASDKSHKCFCSVALICHCGIDALSAFAPDRYGIGKKGNILTVCKVVQGGLVTTGSIFCLVPSADKHWLKYHIALSVRDTICYTPVDFKSLASLGDCFNVHKIALPCNTIDNMLYFLQDKPLDFLDYGAQDVLITLLYGSRLWGINRVWCLSSTAACVKVIKKSIMSYYNIAVDKNSQSVFDRVYRGMKSVKNGKISTPAGLRSITSLEPINHDVSILHGFAAKSYFGGYNACLRSGVYRDSIFFDYDLESAYATAMCLVKDIDYESDCVIARTLQNVYLSIDDFITPVDPMFCCVDFNFPDTVKYPCIAVHDDGCLIFPLKATEVYASGPSLYLALKLGASVYVRDGVIAKTSQTKTPTLPSSCLIDACKRLVSDRQTAQDLYGKGSIEELLLKHFLVCIYGKISQGVVKKRTWDAWSGEMIDSVLSDITSPERASLITDLVRCILIATINQLEDKGFKSYSVTTDGFITCAPENMLNACDAYGFRDLFSAARCWLTGGDSSVWAIKHKQTVLINPTTRCNVGFGFDKSDKSGTPLQDGYGVLAHGGFIAQGCDKDTYEDRLSTAKAILQRTGRVEYTITEFTSLKNLILGQAKDFYVKKTLRHITLNFDFKRKPCRETFDCVTGVIHDLEYDYVNFETEPYSSIEEYHNYRNTSDLFDCLRTKKEWDLFYQKMRDRENNYKRIVKDIDWAMLFSVVQGYRLGLWDLPAITAATTLAEKIKIINSHNTSPRTFKVDDWKNARRPERSSQMLSGELLTPLLTEFNARKA